MVVDHIPRTIRPGDETVLNRLTARPAIIFWDESGQEKLEGETISQSNVSDLVVSDVLRARENLMLLALEFFCVLSKINIPNEMKRDGWNLLATKTIFTCLPRAYMSDKNFQSMVKKRDEKPQQSQKCWYTMSDQMRRWHNRSGILLRICGFLGFNAFSPCQITAY